MALPPKSVESPVPYAPYIEELQKVLSVRGQHFGSPEDLPALVESLSTPSPLRKEVVSLLRSFVFRENEQITTPQLAALLTAAVGGPEVDPAAPALQDTLKTLRSFVSDVRRSLWQTVPEPPSEAEVAAKPQPPVAAAQPISPAAETSAGEMLSPDPLPSIPSHEPVRSDLSQPGPGPASRPGNNMFLRASLMSAASEPPVPLEETEKTNTASTERSPRAITVEPIAPATPLWRRFGWLIALCVLILSVFTGLLLRTYQGASDVADDVPQITAPSSANTQAARPAAITSPFAPGFGALSSTHPGQGVLFVSSGLMTDNLLSAVPPAYPGLASLLHIQGPVVMQAIVSPDGTISATRVLRGNWLLRRAAEHAVLRWRYRPYVLNGRAIDISTIITLQFQLQR